jgi:hypothetical protein
MEDELAGVVANGENGGMDWPLGAQHAHLIKTRARSFTLQDLTGDDFALINWADAPELHDKIILQSWHNPCYVLPGSDDFIGQKQELCLLL